MSDVAIAVVLGLAGPGVTALATVLQELEATQVPTKLSMRPRLLWALVKRPAWIGAWLLLQVGFGLQLAAMRFGSLVLVAPLNVIAIAASVLIGAAITKTRVSARTWVGVAMTTAGLALFVAVMNPTGGNDSVGFSRWILAIVVGAVIAVAFVIAGRRRRSAAPRAALWGVAAGIVFGFNTAIGNGVAAVVNEHMLGAFGNWYVYGMVISMLIATMIQQSAFQEGALAPAICTQASLNPAIATILGFVAFGETLNEPTLSTVIGFAGVAIAIAGMVVTATTHDRIRRRDIAPI